jgi:predicted RNA-binding protein YlxR (DUF448 family)
MQSEIKENFVYFQSEFVSMEKTGDKIDRNLYLSLSCKCVIALCNKFNMLNRLTDDTARENLSVIRS